MGMKHCNAVIHPPIGEVDEIELYLLVLSHPEETLQDASSFVMVFIIPILIEWQLMRVIELFYIFEAALQDFRLRAHEIWLWDIHYEISLRAQFSRVVHSEYTPHSHGFLHVCLSTVFCIGMYHNFS